MVEVEAALVAAEVGCHVVADPVVAACSVEAVPAVAWSAVAVVLVAVEVGSAVVEAWNVAVAVEDLVGVVVDLAAVFRRKASQAVCSVKAERWVLMVAEA